MYWYFWGYMSISKLWHGWWLNVFEWITKNDIATSAASCRWICDFLTKNAQIDIMIERWRCYTQITSCLTMNNLQIFWLLVFKMLGGFWIILVWCWLPDVSFSAVFWAWKFVIFSLLHEIARPRQKEWSRDDSKRETTNLLKNRRLIF